MVGDSSGNVYVYAMKNFPEAGSANEEVRICFFFSLQCYRHSAGGKTEFHSPLLSVIPSAYIDRRLTEVSFTYTSVIKPVPIVATL
ncbi:unnamed protein product [Taenia asiatica]|uniref:Enhancer of mRNA-decapping protein 4 n=1 Tax=Taenia asiatica TaxID=60517 RepID=A0A0R3W0S3_TAEAS|nr:unnamed protein product [Taenia asiatica]